MIDKEFAIKILEQYREKPTLINEIETVEEAVWLDEALTMGIKALSQEPYEDVVSRECNNCAYYVNGANDEACDGCFEDEHEHPNFKPKAHSCEDTISRQEAIDAINQYISQFDAIDANFLDGLKEAVNIVKKLPSAQTESSGDAISRQGVMDCFKKWQPYMATRLWDFEQELSKLPSVKPQYTDAEIQKMQELEQAELEKAYELGRAEQQWIPVSERMPDADEEVLVDDGLNRFVAWWIDYGIYSGWHSLDDNYNIDRPVLAWMPLPASYKAKSEDTECK